MKFYVFKIRCRPNALPWIAYSANRASAFATWAEALDYADSLTPAEATA